MPLPVKILSLLSISSLVLRPARAMSGGPVILRCDFEVFGIVQGVFFRKYTEKKAKELGVRGWCQNTSQDTVVGVIEGEEKNYRLMKDWLQHTGSPQSRIDKAEFKNEKQIDNFTFPNFSIKH